MKCSTYLWILFLGYLLISNPVVEGNWTWMEPTPQGNALFGVWVDTSGTVFAVGACGTVTRWENPEFTCWNLTPSTLRAIWGVSADDVFAVGDGGAIFHFDGQDWTAIPSGNHQNLKGIWGSSSSNIYAVGQAGLILHFNGTDWSTQPSDTSDDLSVIWGISSSQIYAAGGQSVIRFNGTDWSNNPLPTRIYPSSIWASGPSNIYVAGNANYLYQYNGSQWNQVSIPDYNVCSIAGENADDIEAITTDGNFLHWNGVEWISYNSSTTPLIWTGRKDPDETWIGAGEYGTIIRWKIDHWEHISDSMYSYNTVTDIAALSENEVYVPGPDGSLMKWDGIQWTIFQPPPDVHLSKLCAFASDDIWASSENAVFQWNGHTWNDRTPVSSITIQDLHGLSPNEVYVAEPYPWNLYRWDGVSWTQFSSESYPIESLWGNSAIGLFEIHNVNEGGPTHPIYYGSIMHWNGQGWDSVLLKTGMHFKGLWGSNPGDLYAASNINKLYHYNGEIWEELQVPFLNDNLSTAFGFDDGSIYCFGGSRLSYWNGSVWQPIDLPFTSHAISNVSASGPDNIWVAGNHGELLKGDSKTSRLGVEISMPQFISPDETFYVNGFLHNSGDQLLNADVYFILDVSGEFFFWDDWKRYQPPDYLDIDSVNMDVNPGVTSVIVVPEFVWPGSSGAEIHGLILYGGMLDSESQQLIGDIDICEWGYRL